MTNRAFDIWLPLFIITNAIDDAHVKSKIYESLDKYSQMDQQRKQERDRDDNESGVMVEAIMAIIKDGMPFKTEGNLMFFDPNVVHENLTAAEAIPGNMKKKALSRLLRRTLDIKSVPTSVNGQPRRLYVIDREKIGEMQRRYVIV